VVTRRIAPLRKAEEERVKRERDAAVTAFHELLAERGVTEGTRWAKVTRADTIPTSAFGDKYVISAFDG
jgi:hypothetical protein